MSFLLWISQVQDQLHHLVEDDHAPVLADRFAAARNRICACAQAWTAQSVLSGPVCEQCVSSERRPDSRSGDMQCVAKHIASLLKPIRIGVAVQSSIRHMTLTAGGALPWSMLVCGVGYVAADVD